MPRGPGAYRSQDGGRTWRVLPALRALPSEPQWSFPGRPWTHHVRTIALHPDDPGRLLVGLELGGVMFSRDTGTLLLSADAGESWERPRLERADVVDLAAASAACAAPAG